MPIYASILMIQEELDRRRPGQSRITTPRKESDTCEIYSGVSDGISLGTPICIMVPNTDQKSQDYSEMSVAYRPSHADATYDMKYGIRAVRSLFFFIPDHQEYKCCRQNCHL